jgi:transcriptional regulator with XRE-family HTH domain
MKNTVKNNYASQAQGKMETVGDRLSKFLDKTGLSRKDIAKEADVVFSTVSNYLDKDELPGPKFLAHLIQRHRINVEWLLSGEGPMILRCESPERADQVAESPANYDTQVVELKHRLADQILEAAQMREAMGKQQSLIFEAVRKACRELGLSPEQTRMLQWAVMDYDGAHDFGQSSGDETTSHQHAVGD